MQSPKHKPMEGTKHIAKPRSTEANMIIKHRSKQINMDMQRK